MSVRELSRFGRRSACDERLAEQQRVMCVALARRSGDVKAAFGDRSGGSLVEECVRTVAIARPGKHDRRQQQVVRGKVAGRRKVTAHDVRVGTTQQMRVGYVRDLAFATRNGVRRRG